MGPGSLKRQKHESATFPNGLSEEGSHCGPGCMLDWLPQGHPPDTVNSASQVDAQWILTSDRSPPGKCPSAAGPPFPLPFKEMLPLQSGVRVSVVSWPRVSSGWAHTSLPHHTTSYQKLRSRDPTLLRGKSRSQAYCCGRVWGGGQNDSKVCRDKQRQKESQESYEKKSSEVQWRKKGRQEGGGR